MIPDPIPEPKGDVIVVDARGNRWTRATEGCWEHDADGRLDGPWLNLIANYGPVKIYRLEETK